VRDFRKLKLQSNKFSKVSALQFSSLLGGSFYKGNTPANNSPVSLSKSGDGIGDAEVVRYAIQISKAVKELHDRRMIHCDLKSDNVMATQNGSILKLGDFGRIQQLDNLTHKGPTGSLGYMAPELLDSEAVATPPVDVFSLGVILFELMTGTIAIQDGWLMHREIAKAEVAAHKKLKTEMKKHGFCDEIIKLTLSMLYLLPKKRPNIAQVLAELIRLKDTKFPVEIQLLDLQDKFAHLQQQFLQEHTIRVALEDMLTKERLEMSKLRSEVRELKRIHTPHSPRSPQSSPNTHLTVPPPNKQ